MPSSRSDLITVVIPVHNRAELVKRTLRSLETQTLAPARIILVDNASTDGTLDVLRRWSDAREDTEVLVETKKGACAARNAGLRRVETPWVMFFDSDDEMHPNHVADFDRGIREHPQADIIGRDTALQLLDGRCVTGIFDASDIVFANIFSGALATQRKVERSRLVRAAGAWREDIPCLNDFELGMRMLALKPSVARLPGPPSVTVHSQEVSLTGTSFSSRAKGMDRAYEAARRTVEEHPDSFPPATLHWLDLRQLILAACYAREGHPELAKELRERVTARAAGSRSLWRRMQLSAVYLWQRRIGVGARFIARL